MCRMRTSFLNKNSWILFPVHSMGTYVIFNNNIFFLVHSMGTSLVVNSNS